MKNPVTELRSLLGIESRTPGHLGVVAAYDPATHTARVALNGQIHQVSATSRWAAGDRVVVWNGAITGPAPASNPVEIP